MVANLETRTEGRIPKWVPKKKRTDSASSKHCVPGRDESREKYARLWFDGLARFRRDEKWQNCSLHADRRKKLSRQREN